MAVLTSKEPKSHFRTKQRGSPNSGVRGRLANESKMIEGEQKCGGLLVSDFGFAELPANQ
jgi:hypothetical protein